MCTAAIIHNYPIHYEHLLFRELKRQGLDFVVLFTAAGSKNRIETLALSQDIYRFRIGFRGPYERHPRLPTFRFIWGSLSELTPEVVVISGWYDVAAWAAWYWAERYGRPRILWAESNRFDRPRHFWSELPKRLFVRGCAAANVYGVSNLEYLTWLGMPGERIFTKRAVADVERFVGAAVVPEHRPAHKVVLYVGRFSPEKNLEFLLRAFVRLSQDPTRPKLMLAMAGYGPLEGKLRGMVDALGLQGLVEFWGSKRQEELPAVYRRADALVLPSVREPWGLVVLEAMLCGLPVLVSARCGCARDLVTAETGWVFSPCDEARLACLLEAVADLPREKLQQMGSAGRALARQYSPENCARIVIATIQKVLEEKSARSCSSAC